MSKAPPRRAGGPRSAPRGAPVVRAVIRATFEELAEVGFAALSIDDVAKRAGVNKTTVYRRWPTKADLVTTALLALPEEYFTMPNTGTIRGDVTEIAEKVARIFRSFEGRAMMRLLFFEGRLTQLAHVEAHYEARRQATGMPAVVNRAIARGELPVGFDEAMLSDVLVGTITCKVLADKVALSREYLARLVDLVIGGMLQVRPQAPAAAPRAVERVRSVRRRRAS